MDPITILAAANAGIALVEQLIPIIAQLKGSGLITVEQQQILLAKYNSLKDKADGQFSGPEWDVT